MGIDHGLYCVGCCWSLMVILFAVGLMHMSWMLLLTLVIFAEKISKHGWTVGKIAGISLVAAGILIILEFV